MSERSPKTNNAPLSPNTGLKPALQSVLESLDIKLESELTRYRRQKRGESVQASYSGNGLTPPQKTAVDLISLTPKSNPSQQSPTLELSSAQPLKFEASSVKEQQNQPLVIPAIATFGDNGSGDNAGTPNETGLSTESAGALVGPSPGTDPKEYLDSSEKLVNSLNRENAHKLAELRARRKTRSKNSLLSPVGIGSMLLFLAASSTLIYVVTQTADPKDATVRTQANSGGNTNGLSREPAPGNQAPKITPDLTNSQFKPLDLGNLGTLEKKPLVTVPAPTPQPTVPASGGAIAPTVTPNPAPGTPSPGEPGLSNLTTDYLAGSGQPVVIQPSVPSSPPSMAPNAGTLAPATPATPATAAPATPTPTSGVSPASFPGFYYVVMDYQNEESLWKAREVVPDAYLREYPIGVKIQVAAFEDEPSAQAMVEQIKKQGSTAKIYKP